MRSRVISSAALRYWGYIPPLSKPEGLITLAVGISGNPRYRREALTRTVCAHVCLFP